MKVLTTWQTFSMIFLFQLGSSIVFGFSGGAKQDAWISVGISTFIGCGLIWMYSKLFEWYPDKNWISLLIHLFGRYFGNIVASVYILIFIYDAGRVLRDFGELMNNFILPRTPVAFTMFLFLLLIAYACFAGIERMARFAEITILVVILNLLIQFIILASSEVLDLSLLFPIGEDWKHIGTTVFPLGVTVPFGETFAFTLFWTQLVQPNKFRKMVLLSSILIGIILALLDILAVGTLGPEMFSRSFYPLLSTFQLISVTDTINNLDPIVVTNFLVCGFFKILVFTYAALTGITTQWKIDKYRAAIIPVSILVWLLAFYMTKNMVSHLFVGPKWVTLVMWVPLFIIIPLFAVILAKVKKKALL